MNITELSDRLAEMSASGNLEGIQCANTEPAIQKMRMALMKAGYKRIKGTQMYRGYRHTVYMMYISGQNVHRLVPVYGQGHIKVKTESFVLLG